MLIEGPSGKLELIVTEQTVPSRPMVAVICHPNPLYDGTMHNKVVTTLAKGCDVLGFHHVRFNYRGVGNSEGEYGNVFGEIDDCKAVIAYARSRFPDADLCLMGFSFGAHIAAAVANEGGASLLVSVAPAVNYEDYTVLTQITCPWFAVIAGNDELIPQDLSNTFINSPPSPLEAVTIEAASHFFHGKLIELRCEVVRFVGDHA
jgi:uncharacterized protein